MRWSFIDDYDERYVMGFDMAKLTMDTFYMNITKSDNQDVSLYTLHKECVECPYIKHHATIPVGLWYTDKFSTNLKFRIVSESPSQNPADNVICDLDSNFGQFGVYHVHVTNTECDVTTIKQPVNIYLPIFTVFLIYLALFAFIYGIYFIWSKWNGKKKIIEDERMPKKERVQSLDTFRGITIVLMIFANFGSGGYEFIDHATWNGLHVADLVFPFFMWIMGVCIPISLTSVFKKAIPNRTIMTKVLKRSIKLFCIGMFLGSGSDLNYLRIFGVLQRFGIAYFVVTTICLFCMQRSTSEKVKKQSIFDDILKIVNGWFIVLALLVIHTIIISYVAAPDCPRGYLGPGGMHQNWSYINCTGGATGYIDGLILGNHRYQYPTIYEIYGSGPFDPEGIVGCLTTIFQVFIGVQAGVTLIVYKNHAQRITRWLSWAAVTGIIGGALCQFSKEDGIIPVNKNLWSQSFVMVTSCFAFTLLSLCYITIDAKKWWSGKPFLFAGMNAILMYIGHEMTDGHFPVRWYVHNDLGDARRTHFLAFFSDTWGAGIWVLVSYYLYKINYFFTV